MSDQRIFTEKEARAAKQRTRYVWIDGKEYEERGLGSARRSCFQCARQYGQKYEYRTPHDAWMRGFVLCVGCRSGNVSKERENA